MTAEQERLEAEAAFLAALRPAEPPPATVWLDRDAVRLELAYDEVAADLGPGVWVYQLPPVPMPPGATERPRRQVLHAHLSATGRWVLVTWWGQQGPEVQLLRPGDVVAVEYDEVTEHRAGGHALDPPADCPLCQAVGR